MLIHRISWRIIASKITLLYTRSYKSLDFEPNSKKVGILLLVISDGKKDDVFLVDRTIQALETVDWISRTSSENVNGQPWNCGKPDLIILAGDLNTEPEFLPYQVLIKLGSMTDPNGKSDIVL